MTETEHKAQDKKRSREKASTPENKKLLYAPLICGILAGLSFLVYLWSANTPDINLTFAVYFIPFFCLAGTIIAIINRKDINNHPAIWTFGFLISTVGLLFCIFMIMLLFMLLGKAGR